MFKQIATPNSPDMVGQIARWVRFILPEGRPLPAAEWQRRHTGILIILWLHAVGIFFYALHQTGSLPHSVFESGLIAATALLATPHVLSRQARAVLASLGLLISSSLLVHLSGGVTEMHFHFFVMLSIIAIYQSWKPFLLAVLYVLLEHGLLGMIAPDTLYDRPEAWAEPGKWALIHTVFVLGVSIASIVTWRLAEAASLDKEQILNATSEGIYGIDNTGNITFINPAAAQLLGWQQDQLIGKVAHPLFHRARTEDAPFAFDECSACAEAGNNEHTGRGEQLFWRKDGTNLLVQFACQPLITPGGRAGAVVTFRDVTEQRRTRDALKSSEEYYRGVFQNAHDAILIFDPETEIILDANNRAGEIYGFSQSEFIGMSLRDLSSDSGYGTTMILETLADQGSHNFETIHYRKDGSEMFLDVNATLITRGGKRAILSINRDITERKRNEQETRNREAAEAANRAKTEFLSRMSHELRTPLNAILGFGQLLEMDDNNEQQRESIGHIMHGGRHLLMLIDEVLDIARIEEGRLALSLEEVSLQQALWESWSMVQGLASQRNITISTDIDDLTDTFVVADLQRLKQVLLNLLANAVKYNRKGGSVNISTTTSEGRLRLSISDTGLGIEPEKVPFLFVPFERLGAEHTDIEGTGLGLALSKRLVEAMQGTIGASSEVGKGATFWIELPLAVLELDAGLEELKPDQDPTAIASGIVTILYVEDNLSNLRLVETVLSKRPNIRLVSSRVGLSTDLVALYNPDLILLDLHLPERSGYEMLIHLKADQQTSAIPVVVVSADATPRQIERTLAAGARAYLTKPLDVRRLLQVVDESMVREVAQVA